MGAHEDRMTRLQEAEFRNDLLRKDVETRVQDAREDQERIAALEDALAGAAAYLRLAVTWIEDGERRGKMKAAAERAGSVLASEGTPEEAQDA